MVSSETWLNALFVSGWAFEQINPHTGSGVCVLWNAFYLEGMRDAKFPL